MSAAFPTPWFSTNQECSHLKQGMQLPFFFFFPLGEHILNSEAIKAVSWSVAKLLDFKLGKHLHMFQSKVAPFSLNSTVPHWSVLIHQSPRTKMNNLGYSLNSTDWPVISVLKAAVASLVVLLLHDGTQSRMLGCFACQHTGFLFFFFGLNSCSSVYDCETVSVVALCTDICFQYAFISLMWQIAIPYYNYHADNKKYILLSHCGPRQRHNHSHWTLSKL